MAQDSTTYLAANVLNDGNIVTYRSLARVFKVHSNTAKRMLYDFHQKLNSKKPGCVHATYLVSGVRVAKAAVNEALEKDGEDVHMQSSPFMSRSMPHQDTEEDGKAMRVMTLVQEQHLDVVKSNYESITSIHIYSLEPNAIQNLQILSDVKRELAVSYAKDDPLVVGKHYGTIQNSQVKRRTGPRPITMPASVAATSSKVDLKPASRSTPIEAPEMKPKESKLSQPQLKSEAKLPHSQDKGQNSFTKKTALKREQSDIFKSFSKPKITREDTGSSIEAVLAPVTPISEPPTDIRDESMEDVSEDEKEEDVVALTNGVPKDVSSQRKSKSERAEALRRMMDDEDEHREDTADDHALEAAISQPTDASPSQEEAPAEASISVTAGRRRGRRKVMKKKMLKDEEGYLVTKEEAAWESFSEDDAPPPIKARAPTSTASSSAPTKAKKTSANPGQGNIMSFFGKK
ncbi:hypothetical protein MMC13_000909 [Lambiella insularis]|nr:hypothetical protein [Lambiella insularis]